MGTIVLSRSAQRMVSLMHSRSGVACIRFRFQNQASENRKIYKCSFPPFVLSPKHPAFLFSQNTKARMAEILPARSASFLLDFASCSAATALCSVMSTPQVIPLFRWALGQLAMGRHEPKQPYRSFAVATLTTKAKCSQHAWAERRNSSMTQDMHCVRMQLACVFRSLESAFGVRDASICHCWASSSAILGRSYPPGKEGSADLDRKRRLADSCATRT